MAEPSTIDPFRQVYKVCCGFLLVWGIIRLTYVYYQDTHHSPVTQAPSPAPQPVSATGQKPQPGVKTSADPASPHPQPATDPSPVPPEPRPAYKLMHMAPNEGQPQFFSVFLEECHHAADKIRCSGQVTNVSDEIYHFYLPDSSDWVIVGDKGNTLRGGDDGFGGKNLLSNVPVNFTLQFDEPHSGVQTINMSIVAGNPFPVTGSGAPADGRHRLTFSNVRVQ